MNKLLLLIDLAKLLTININDLNDDFLLTEEANWDSLSLISTVAVIDQHYNIQIKGTELMSCNSIGDIFSLIENKNKLSKVEYCAS